MSETSTQSLNPILPDKQPEERPLLFILTVMAFLTALTVLSSLIGSRVNTAWQSDLSGSATVQIFIADDADPELVTNTALSTLRRNLPNANVALVSEQESQKLLEPWLGDGAFLEDLPLPVLIRIDGAGDLDASQLSSTLGEQNITVEIDDHSRWQENMRATWRIIRLAMLSIIIIIFSASVFVASYATQSVLRARQNIIDVLAHVGARHGYVAKLFIVRFLSLGLKGAFLGAVLALIALTGFVTILRFVADTNLPGLYPRIGDLIWLSLIAAILGLISAGTAGFVTLSKLRQDHLRA